MKASRLLCFLLCLTLLAAAALPALAQRDYYILPDSATRYLTQAELWDWQYEALGYIYNEIFARHGRSFRTGEKYDVYFRSQSWYSVNPRYSYSLLSACEQANEALVHQVLKDMRAQKTTNPGGRPMPWSDTDAMPDTVFSFRSYNLISGQKLPVYTGPGAYYYRSANGKAAVSTNGRVRIAGAENGWLLVEYEVNSGSMRVGYIQQSQLRDRLSIPALALDGEEGLVVATPCALTDEPDGRRTTLVSLAYNTPVTLLGNYTMASGGYCTYVEVQTDWGAMRGFVPTECITGSVGEYYLQHPEDGSGYDWSDENANG